MIYQNDYTLDARILILTNSLRGPTLAREVTTVGSKEHNKRNRFLLY